EIAISKIEANPFQPRTEFKPLELQELSDSIKTHGVIQPITVRAIGGDKFQIISGERRWRASKKAGLKSIPAYVRVTDDQGLLEMAIVENIQRSDLNSMEVAISFQRLIDECNISHEEMASRVNKNRSTVTNYLRLLKLPPKIQKALKNDNISMGHARALIGVEPKENQLEVFKRVIQSGLSVRATEELIKSFKASPSSKGKKAGRPSAIDLELKKIKSRLEEYYETKVDIKRNAKGKGSFILHFGSDDQFNELLDLLEE
ncbi:UNVERIFIED_CONTAM: hypothetical protein GTU68_018362, partial [Idotea baltica]|nr:hypothetical protein [Idotea baltica]